MYNRREKNAGPQYFAGMHARETSMEREEIYGKLYDDAEVYRPPLEAKSALLEVAHGCSYGKCAFCDFSRDAFYPSELETIERKIKLLSQVIDGNPRVHFLGSNSLCLPTAKLLAVMDMVHRDLPSVREISMYARADDINRKSKGELLALSRAGLAELHIGLESGSNTVLELQNKGETAEEIARALTALEVCRIGYHLTVIPGLGGKQYSAEHAEHTAAFLNRFHPLSVWCMALKIWPETELFRMVERGSFEPLSLLEILEEERSMIAMLELGSPCLYVDSTILHRYSLVAELPEQKASALAQIDRIIGGEVPEHFV